MKLNTPKRITALFIAGVLTVSSLTTVFADETAQKSYDEAIAVIHTNDVHGHIEVEPYVKGLADQMKASGDYSLVLTISAGDVYDGGKAVAGYFKGELIPAIEDQVYDVIVPGNNDFPGGLAQNILLTSLYTKTKTICANQFANEDVDMAAYTAAYQAAIGNEDFADTYDNVKLKKDGTLDFSKLGIKNIAKDESPWEKTAVVTTSKGTKLGLFGLSCTGGQQAGFCHSAGTITDAKAAVDSLKKDGATVIVGIAHTGWTGEGSTDAAPANDTNSWAVANEIQEMDALIDSHTHSIINDGNGCYVGANKVLVNQAACFGDCIGVMYFYLKDGKVIDKKAEVLRGDALESITPDAKVLKTVNADLKRIQKIAGPSLVKSPVFLNGERISAGNAGGTIRGNETNLGDFITDVILNAASEKRGVKYDFTFFPGYWLRSSIDKDADITKIEIASVVGMPTKLVEQDYSAQEIVDLVTGSLAAVYPQAENITFYQYSGLNILYTNEGGVGTPVAIKVGDTLIYDANNGGIQVGASWKAKGVRTLHADAGEYTGDASLTICEDQAAVQEMIREYLSKHEAGKDYTFYPNTVAPDGRVVEIDKAEAASHKNDASPFLVKVTATGLNIRVGAGIDTAKTGLHVPAGIYTIVEVVEGKGSAAGWGKLKSGAGYISLDYAKKI